MSLFGTNTASAEKNQGVQEAGKAKSSILQYRNTREVLSLWEERLKSQSEAFHNYAMQVVDVDCEVIKTARNIRELDSSHAQLQNRAKELSSLLDNIENQQKAIGDILSQLGHVEQEGPVVGQRQQLTAQEKTAAVVAQVNDMERQIKTLNKDLERLNAGFYGSADGVDASGVVSLLNDQDRQLAALSEKVGAIEKKIASVTSRR